MNKYLAVLTSTLDDEYFVAFVEADSDYEAGALFLEEFVGWDNVRGDAEDYVEEGAYVLPNLNQYAADCDYNLIVTLAKDIEEL